MASPPGSPAPFPHSPLRPAPPLTGDRRGAVTPPPARGGPRILIVDDNPDNVTILRDRLQARGYSTIVANDGEEALAIVAALAAGAAAARQDPASGP
ncbi:MAG: response regulator, partial [Gemmatimonadales bacterium]